MVTWQPKWIGIDYGKGPSVGVVQIGGGQKIGKTERVSQHIEQLLDEGYNVMLPDGTVLGADFARDVTEDKG